MVYRLGAIATVLEAIRKMPIKCISTCLLPLLILLLSTSGYADVIMSRNTDIALDNNCEPKGIIATIHVRISSKDFWVKQLEEIEKAIKNQRMRPEKTDELLRELDAFGKKMEASLEEQYRKHPRLRPSPAERRAKEFRKEEERIKWAAEDAITKLIVRERTELLENCRRKIMDRLSR